MTQCRHSFTTLFMLTDCRPLQFTRMPTIKTLKIYTHSRSFTHWHAFRRKLKIESAQTQRQSPIILVVNPKTYPFYRITAISLTTTGRQHISVSSLLICSINFKPYPIRMAFCAVAKVQSENSHTVHGNMASVDGGQNHHIQPHPFIFHTNFYVVCAS